MSQVPLTVNERRAGVASRIAEFKQLSPEERKAMLDKSTKRITNKKFKYEKKVLLRHLNQKIRTSADVFTKPIVYNDNVIKFFTDPSNVAYLGYENVAANNKDWSINDMSFTFEPDGRPLNDVLREDFPIFSKDKVANINTMRLLFNIYFIVNNLRANAASNEGKPFSEWKTKIAIDDRMQQYFNDVITSNLLGGQPLNDFNSLTFLAKTNKSFVNNTMAYPEYLTRSFEVKTMFKIFGLEERIIKESFNGELTHIKYKGRKSGISKCEIESKMYEEKKKQYSSEVLDLIKDNVNNFFLQAGSKYTTAEEYFKVFIEVKRLEYFLTKIYIKYQLLFCHINHERILSRWRDRRANKTLKDEVLNAIEDVVEDEEALDELEDME